MSETGTESGVQQRLMETELAAGTRDSFASLPKATGGVAPQDEQKPTALMRLIQHRWFERFILLVILGNCVMLALDDPRAHCDKNRDCDDLQRAVYISAFVFLSIFTIEAAVKLLALGVRRYFTDAWNWLDFIVVLLGYLSLIPSFGNFQFLRTLRILRALRSISQIPALRKVVGSLLNAIPLLGDVLMLCGFVVLLFSIFGLQLFSGSLRQYCADADGNFPSNPDDWVTCSRSTGGVHCEADSMYPRCVRSSSIYDNPNNGMTNFDHLGYAFLTVFQMITQEGWSGNMYLAMDATTSWSVVYFLSCIWLGSLITISLTFAALESTWESTDNEATPTNQPSLFERFAAYFRTTSLGKIVAKFSLKRTWLGRNCFTFVTTPCFQWFMLYAIIANTIVLAMNRAHMSDGESKALDRANFALTIVFACELVLKIIAYGTRGYFGDSMNQFDAFVVVVSILELTLTSSSLFTVFRALRLLRLLKLVRSWGSLRRMVAALRESAQASASLCGILVLILFMFALFAKEMWGADYEKFDRWNYRNFPNAFYSVFVVLSSENWISFMYDTGRVEGRGYAAFYVLLMIVGNFVLLNLFIAVILDRLVNAVDDDGDDDTADNKLLDQEISEKEAWMKRMFTGKTRPRGKSTQRSSETLAPPVDSSTTPIANASSSNSLVPPVAVEMVAKTSKRTRQQRLKEKFDYFDTNQSGWIDEKEVKKLLEYFKIELTMLEYHVIFADDRFTFDEFMDLMDKYDINISDDGIVTSRATSRPKFTAAEKRMLKKFDLDADLIVTPDMEGQSHAEARGNSLFIFGPTNRFRRWMISLANSKHFGQFVLVCIALSTITVALDEPGRSKKFKDTLKVFDIIFTTVFLLELAVKVVAMGFVLGPTTYLRDSDFNKLDFVVIALSCATLFMKDSNGGAEVGSLKAFRAFRALRPLRTVGRIDNLKVVVNALLQAARPVANAMALLAFFYLMFGILAVNLFAGKFHYCRELSEELDPSTVNATIICPETDFNSGLCGDRRCTSSDCYPCYLPGETVPQNRVWDLHHQNFDNVVNAMVVLFEMSTFEQWPDIALQAVDATGSDTWPDQDHNQWRFLFFIVYIMMGSMFIVNLFASVACDKYNRMSEFYSGMLFLTDKQKVWVIDAKQVVAAKPTKIVIDPIIVGLDKYVLTPLFDNFIMLCIVLNMVVLSMTYEGMSTSYSNGLDIANTCFIAIFALEMVLKILALGPEVYITNHWNKFDALVVILSLIGLGVNIGGFVSVFRVLRIARLLKLVPKAKRLMTVVETVYLAMPALANIGLLTTLFFIIYACLGMNLFGTTVHGDFLNRRANFETFPVAMLTLFRATTGEDWNGLMYDCALKEGQFGTGDQTCSGSDCGVNYAAQVFWISFVILATFIMFNLILAAVVTQFELCKQSAEGLNNQIINGFKEAWCRFDPDAVARIQVGDFPEFFKMVGPLFGFKPEDYDRFEKKCEASGGELRFSEVLFVLAFERFGATLGTTKKGVELEQAVQKMKIKLDEEPKMSEKPVLPQLTEWQLMSMTADELREELKKRGHVRIRNRGTSTMFPEPPVTMQDTRDEMSALS